jgi:DNA-binding NarL/FixJ family response regulator
MKLNQTKASPIHIALIDTDPLRLIGFRALMSQQTGFELIPVGLADFANHPEIDVAILRNQPGRSALDVMRELNCKGLSVRVLVTGCHLNDEFVIESLTHGAKGYLDESASAAEFAQALRTIHEGSVWASRRVLAKFVEQASAFGGQPLLQRKPLTEREKEILAMLVTGRSNKEISAPLGIEERTVKAHVSKLMRKVGVDNRVALSVHAVTHSLVSLA